VVDGFDVVLVGPRSRLRLVNVLRSLLLDRR
jgi:hypothetical protein